MNTKGLENLSDEARHKIEKLVLEKPNKAILDLERITGCSKLEAKTWVDKKREEAYIATIPPCPYCGERLRTPVAKQCRFCLLDWHDENNLAFLK